MELYKHKIEEKNFNGMSDEEYYLKSQSKKGW